MPVGLEGDLHSIWSTASIKDSLKNLNRFAFSSIQGRFLFCSQSYLLDNTVVLVDMRDGSQATEKSLQLSERSLHLSQGTTKVSDL